jgi:hypothetical protein
MSVSHICPACDGEKRVLTSRWGGNDPDQWYIRCETCDGTGEKTQFCEGLMCKEIATELVTSPCGSVEPYCARCAVTAREDAGMEPEPRGFW